jgi:hypothetical protein
MEWICNIQQKMGLDPKQSCKTGQKLIYKLYFFAKCDNQKYLLPIIYL